MHMNKKIEIIFKILRHKQKQPTSCFWGGWDSGKWVHQQFKASLYSLVRYCLSTKRKEKARQDKTNLPVLNIYSLFFGGGAIIP